MENVKNCFYVSQGCKISAFLRIHSHLFLNVSFQNKQVNRCRMHSEQAGNDRLFCLLRGFLYPVVSKGISITNLKKKLEWFWKKPMATIFTQQCSRALQILARPWLQYLSSNAVEHFRYLPSNAVEHFRYWPGPGALLWS